MSLLIAADHVVDVKKLIHTVVLLFLITMATLKL
jgi:hypothetical protein